MQCFVCLVSLALVFVACAAPSPRFKLLSESSGRFLRVDSTSGIVTADALPNDASDFTMSLTPSGNLQFQNSGRYLGITASGTLRALMDATEGDIDLGYFMAGSDPNTFGLKVQRGGGETCFVGFQGSGQPVDDACTGLSSSSIETYLQRSAM